MKKKRFSLITAGCVLALFHAHASAAPDPNFHCYLCFGQSNMAGGCKPGDANDCDTTSARAKRVKVLAFMDCNTQSTACTSYRLVRTFNKWYTAFPPYNNCSEGIGPADYFGKTLLDSIRDDITIGFIPCSFSGQSIVVYQKGNTTPIPSWAHPTVGTDGYGFVVSRCRIAQQAGVIKGFLFHQGESDAGAGDGWVDKVVGIVKSLKTDLGLSDSIPFIAGELRYQSENGCCYQLNPYINKLPQRITNCAVVSANGIKARNPDDEWRAHFDTPSMREFGRRYAMAFLKVASPTLVPRKGSVPTVSPSKPRPVSAATIRSWSKGARIYTLQGKVIADIIDSRDMDRLTRLRGASVYLVSPKSSNSVRLMIVP
ncbi:MAG: hypothetical protein JW768_09845 [Chitinispirillaceae bacterium]|nr:hypothetical protein [Chitinispirillaceae bacterium]